MRRELGNVSQRHEKTVQFTVAEVGPQAKFFLLRVNEVVGISCTGLITDPHGTISTCKHDNVRHVGKDTLLLFAYESLKDMKTELANMIMKYINFEKFDVLGL